MKKVLGSLIFMESIEVGLPYNDLQRRIKTDIDRIFSLGYSGNYRTRLLYQEKFIFPFWGMPLVRILFTKSKSTSTKISLRLTYFFALGLLLVFLIGLPSFYFSTESAEFRLFGLFFFLLLYGMYQVFFQVRIKDITKVLKSYEKPN